VNPRLLVAGALPTLLLLSACFAATQVAFLIGRKDAIDTSYLQREMAQLERFNGIRDNTVLIEVPC